MPSSLFEPFSEEALFFLCIMSKTGILSCDKSEISDVVAVKSNDIAWARRESERKHTGRLAEEVTLGQSMMRRVQSVRAAARSLRCSSRTEHGLPRRAVSPAARPLLVWLRAPFARWQPPVPVCSRCSWPRRLNGSVGSEETVDLVRVCAVVVSAVAVVAGVVVSAGRVVVAAGTVGNGRSPRSRPRRRKELSPLPCTRTAWLRSAPCTARPTWCRPATPPGA